MPRDYSPQRDEGRKRDRSPTGRDRDYRDDERSSKRRERDEDDDYYKRKESSSSRKDRERYKERDDDSERRDRKEKKSKHRDRSASPSGKESKAERAARKEAKAAARREREAEEARAVAELSMYTSTDNPFNDANLGVQFKWVKKSEKEKKAGMSREEAERKDAIRRQEAKEELERLNKRRAEREVEAALREEEEARMARLAESAQMAEWVAKEDDFHLEQSRRRAGIRLKEGRAKAIDFLAINLRFAEPDVDKSKNVLGDDLDGGWGWEEAGLDMDLEEPYKIFENLTLQDTEELQADIKMYLSLEKSLSNIEFWESMLTVCKDRLKTLRSSSAYDQSNAAVQQEITKLLSGKTLTQLNQLEASVQNKLRSGEPVDTDYWESLLSSLEVWKAKSKLSAMHEVVLQNRLEQLRLRQREDAEKVQADLAAGAATGAGAGRLGRFGGDMEAEVGDIDDDLEDIEEEEEAQEEWNLAMEPALFNPTTLSYEERQFDVIDETEELRRLFAKRREVTSTKFIAKAARQEEIDTTEASKADLEAEEMYKAEAAKNLDEDEELFNLEENMGEASTYTWEDKYRPRKPRYFNRVHTGFEWNKYNQTHYDSDNPPPKVVQGYKFNIFYPDLINPQVAPTYYIKKDKEHQDLATIVFTAGPPYEDIAFKIVNKEWEHSHKRGFRSSFDRGVLQLYFGFRRNFYRK